MKIRKEDFYTYRVTWSEEDKEFVGLCAEFPSLSWLAGSAVDALKGIRKVVGESILELKRNEDEVPLPLALKDFSGRFVVRVTPGAHRRLAIEAAEEKVSLNRLISTKLTF